MPRLAGFVLLSLSLFLAVPAQATPPSLPRQSLVGGFTSTDLNANGKMDLGDLAEFAYCFFAPPIPPGCERADFDCDGRADDLNDLVVFARSYLTETPYVGECP
ncbi:MAG: hypothetical protein ACREOU_04205 [Candidatus Eiseniibacteriota bacterium]